MHRLTIVVCLAALVFLVSAGLADIPKLINYQGMLTESDGTTPVADGQYNLGFKIYGSESSDDSLWWEYHSSVQVTNGLFNIILGSQSALNLPFDAEYWLETIVETEIMPTRLQFTSVGYAYRALVADSAAVVGSGGSGGWVDDGTVVRLQNSTDSVGIGTTSPGARLQVGDGSSDDCIKVMGSSAAVSAEMGSYMDGFGYLKINDDGGTTTALIDPDGGVSYVKYGSVGIGTTSPVYRLHVIEAGSGDCAVFGQLQSNSNLGILGASSSGVYGFSSTGAGVFGYSTNGTGVVYSGGLAGSGLKSCIVKTSKGPTLLYCQESPENWFEDFGEGRLGGGRCHIELDPLFLETVSINETNPMKVFIQLNDDCNGTYVERGRTGFEVIELQGGQSNARFTYRVVAKRSGFEDKRLDVCEAAKTDPYLYPEMKEKVDGE